LETDGVFSELPTSFDSEKLWPTYHTGLRGTKWSGQVVTD